MADKLAALVPPGVPLKDAANISLRFEPEPEHMLDDDALARPSLQAAEPPAESFELVKPAQTAGMVATNEALEELKSRCREYCEARAPGRVRATQEEALFEDLQAKWSQLRGPKAPSQMLPEFKALVQPLDVPKVRLTAEPPAARPGASDSARGTSAGAPRGRVGGGALSARGRMLLGAPPAWSPPSSPPTSPPDFQVTRCSRLDNPLDYGGKNDGCDAFGLSPTYPTVVMHGKVAAEGTVLPSSARQQRLQQDENCTQQ